MGRARPTELTRLMLLSIKPRHVHNILTGAKTVELRRIRPNVDAGQPVAVYATMPAAAVVATCRVGQVDIGLPSAIKAQHLDRTGISGDEFDNYFAGSSQAVAIHLGEVAVLDSPVTLDQIRLRRGDYNPPQTWHYFDRTQLHDLLGHHGAHRELSALLLR